jgi:hypothetical protein
MDGERAKFWVQGPEHQKFFTPLLLPLLYHLEMLQAITVQRVQALLIDMLFIFELIFGLISFVTVFLTFFPSYYYLIYDFVESTLVPVFQFVYTRCDLKYTWACLRSGGQAVVTVKRVTLRLIGGNNFLTGFNWSYAKSSEKPPLSKLNVVTTAVEPCLNDADRTVSVFVHGIVNTGNSCFLNSVLQVSSSSFKKYHMLTLTLNVLVIPFFLLFHT